MADWCLGELGAHLWWQRNLYSLALAEMLNEQQSDVRFKAVGSINELFY